MKGFMGWYARTLTYLGSHPTRTFAGTLIIIFAIIFWFGATKHKTGVLLLRRP